MRPEDGSVKNALLTGHTVVFGGSFNPPHMGHQMACLYLLQALQAEAIWMVPVCHHPFGKPLAPYRLRHRMCELLAAPFAGRVVVCDVEMTAGTVHTFDTLTYLLQRHPTRCFALAVGADILVERDAWYRWKDIEAMVPITVLGRTGFGDAEMGLNLPQVASRELRARVAAGHSLLGLVPAAVAQFVREHGLYR